MSILQAAYNAELVLCEASVPESSFSIYTWVIRCYTSISAKNSSLCRRIKLRLKLKSFTQLWVLSSPLGVVWMSYVYHEIYTMQKYTSADKLRVQLPMLVPRAAMSWDINSGCAGHAAPVTKLPSVKHLVMGSGSSHSAPASVRVGFRAGYAVHFFPWRTTGNTCRWE